MQSLRQKTNLIFYQIIAIGFIFLSLVIFLSLNLYPKMILVGRSLFNKLETLCGCANLWFYINHPFIFSFIILTSLILLVFIGLAIVRIFKLNRATSKFIKLNISQSKQGSRKLKKVAGLIGLQDKALEVDTSRPVIFCYGFIRPKICISRGLIKKLNQQELLAVLKHEQQHLLSYEPLKIFLTKIITKVLFFIPTLGLLTQKYRTLSELSADEKATQGFKNKVPLIQALEKVMRLKEQMVIKDNLAISFFAVIDERVNKLANDKYMPSLKIFTLKSLITMVIVFIFVASFYIPVYSTQSAMISHTDGSCPMDGPVSSNECQMSPKDSSCLMGQSGSENIFSVCEQMNLN